MVLRRWPKRAPWVYVCRDTSIKKIGKTRCETKKAKTGETVSQSRDSDEKSGARAMTASHVGGGGGKPAEKE